MQTGQWGRGFGAGKAPPPWPLLLGQALVGPAWLLGHCLGLSQWTSEDFRQEPPKGRRTPGQGQGLLLGVATRD